MTLTLGRIADWLHAEGVFDPDAQAVGYSIDSRTVGAGDLFFAVKGDRVDGHDYVEAAIANGAVAAVVSQRWLPPANLDERQVLRVPDECDDCVLSAMQLLARQVRKDWGKRVIGVTGSAGKTTTKDCIAAVLATQFHVLKTEGNFNNHFGLPLQLLRLQPEHDIAVLEMGMNHAGEIRALAQIALPDWAVVSNVAAVHLEYFAEGIAGIAAAKRELVETLPIGGLAVLNADDERVREFAEGLDVRPVLYGLSANADVRADDVQSDGLAGTRFTVHANGTSEELQLRLPGEHNVLNALAACAVGVQSGVPLRACSDALAALRATAKRGEVIEWRGAVLIDDVYNSNPHALNSMVAALAATPATRRIVVAGEMLELGPEAERLHEGCGRMMAAAGVDVVIGVRGLAETLANAAAGAGAMGYFFATPEEAGRWMQGSVQRGDVVLLKASRGVRLERALEVLLRSGGTAE